MKHLRLTIRGKVQGVSFRYYTLQKARELGIKGYVQNLDDGSVYAEAEGDHKALAEFVAWCHHGPMLARVSDVTSVEGDVQKYESFAIRR